VERGTWYVAAEFFHEGIRMQKYLTIASVTLVAALCWSAPAAAIDGGSANADSAASTRAIAHVGGGYWEYGTSNGFVHSFTSHASKTHKATACDGKGRCAYSGWKSKGAYASAIRDKTASGNTAYWGVK
jgi:hypothetical protein